MHKIRTNHTNSQTKPFAYLALLFGLSTGMLFPIFPSFVKEILRSDQNVSFFYAAMGIISFLGGVTSAWLFEKFTRVTVTKYSFIFLGFLSFILIITNRPIEVTIVSSLKFWFELLLITSLGLFIRQYANMVDLGKEEGFYYRYQNIGHLVGPLLGGFIAVNFQYELVFILAGIIMFLALGYFYYQKNIKEHKAITDKKTPKHPSPLSNVKLFFSNPNYVKAYTITLLSMMWVAFKRVYIPLYVISSGYLESVSGILIGLAIVPYILLEVKVGEFADKHDVRVPVKTGLLTMGALLLITFISPYPLVNFILLLLVNIGGAMLEPLGDYYLLKDMPTEKAENYYGVYRTSDQIATFLTMILGGLVLTFFSFKYLFLFFAGLMFIAAIWAQKKLKSR